METFVTICTSCLEANLIINFHRVLSDFSENTCVVCRCRFRLSQRSFDVIKVHKSEALELGKPTGPLDFTEHMSVLQECEEEALAG